MEKRTEVKTIKVEMICDNCGEGKMIATGELHPTNPPIYFHCCDKCNHFDKYRKSYPYIDYE